MKSNTKPSFDKLRKENPKLYQAVANSQFDTMKLLNERTGQVKIGGKIRFVDMEDNPLSFYSKEDMATILAHLKVLDWSGDEINAWRWWLCQEDRRTFSQVVFEPDTRKVPDGALNLFRGFKIRPKAKPDGWSLFADHLRRNVCAGDATVYNFLLDLFAHLFQRPGAKWGLAPVLYGSKGTGKSIVSDILAACVGDAYSPVIDTPDQLTGRFNSHLGKAILIRVEEAIHAKDPRHTSRIKHMITGGRFMIEQKGIDAFEVESRANLIFTTNHLHSVSATGGERRFLAMHVMNGNQQDGEFFGRLKAQMLDKGGCAALVADLLARDISKTDFTRPPATALLSTQIIESMGGLERWWAATLADGRLPFTRAPDYPQDEIEWPDDGAWTVPKAALQESAVAYARDYQGPPTPEAIGKFLAVAIPGLTRSRRRIGSDREHLYIVPPLEECRLAFVAARPGLRLEHVTDAIPEAAGAMPSVRAPVTRLGEVVRFPAGGAV